MSLIYNPNPTFADVKNQWSSFVSTAKGAASEAAHAQAARARAAATAKARELKQRAVAKAQSKVCPPCPPCSVQANPAFGISMGEGNEWTLHSPSAKAAERAGMNVVNWARMMASKEASPGTHAYNEAVKHWLREARRLGHASGVLRQRFARNPEAGTRILLTDASGNIMGTFTRSQPPAEAKAFVAKILAARNLEVEFGHGTCCDAEGYEAIPAVAIPKTVGPTAASRPARRPAPAPTPAPAPHAPSPLKAYRYVRVVEKTGPTTGRSRIYSNSRSVMGAVARARMFVNEWGKGAVIPPEVVVQAGTKKNFSGENVILARYRFENGSWRLVEGGTGLWQQYWAAHQRRW